MAVLNFVFSMAGQFHRRRPAFFNAKLRQEGSSAWFQYPPEFRDEADRSQVEDDTVWRIGLNRQPQPPDPVQRFLMLFGIAGPCREFFLRELDRRHIGHVFVVDHKIDRILYERELLAVGSGADAAPTSFFGSLGLELQERVRNIERDIFYGLSFKRQEFLGHVTGDVAEPTAHFEQDFRFGIEPAKFAQLAHQQAAIGQSIQNSVWLPEEM